MQKNTSGQKIGAQMVSATDGSAFTGSVTVYVTGDAGTQAVGSVSSGACTHEGNGYHTYAPAQAETNYDLIAFTFTGTGAVPATVQIFTRHDANVTHNAGTAITSSSGRQEVNTSHWGGTAVGSTEVRANLINIAGSAVSTSTAQLGVNVVNAAGTAWGSGAITAASIADGAIDAATFAADVDAEILSYLVDDAARIDASALNTATGTTIPAILDDTDLIDDGTSGLAKIATDVAAILVDTAEIGAAGAGLTNINLPNQTMDIVGNITGSLSGSVGSVTGSVGSVTATVSADVVSISGDSTAADNAESYFDGTGYGHVLQRTTIATLSSQTSFTLTAGSADNDAYNGCEIVIQDASTAAQKAVGVVSDYTGSTKTITLLNDPAVFTMATGDTVTLLASRSLKPTVDNRTLDVSTGGEAGVDWANVGSPTTTVGLSGTTVKTATDVETDTADIQSRLPAALVSGRIDASVGAMAANTLTASALATDAVTEIQSGLSTHSAADVWAVATRTLTALDEDSTTLDLDATIRAAVGLASANLDTQLAAIDDYIDSEISAIKTVTDAIGATGSGLSAIPWNAAWDAEVQSEVQDALVANNLDHLVLSAVDTDFATTVHLNSVIGHLADNGTSATFDRTTDSLEAVRDNTGTAGAGLTAADDAVISAIAALNNITAASVWAVATRTLTAGTNIDGSTFTAIPWNASWDAEVQSEVQDAIEVNNLDHLVKAAVDTDFNTTVHANSVVGYLASTANTYDRSTDSQEAIRNRGDAAWTTATGFSTHSAADVWAVAIRVLTAATNITSTGGTTVPQTGDSYAIVSSGAYGNSALNTDLDSLLSRLTSTRAGYLDNLSGGAVALEATAQAILADTGTDGVVVASGSKTGYALSSTGLNAVLPAEPGAVPVWGTTTIVGWMAWVGSFHRNKLTQTATTAALRNDADNANIATSTTSDDGTTFTRGEYS